MMNKRQLVVFSSIVYRIWIQSQQQQQFKSESHHTCVFQSCCNLSPFNGQNICKFCRDKDSSNTPKQVGRYNMPAPSESTQRNGANYLAHKFQMVDRITMEPDFNTRIQHLFDKSGLVGTMPYCHGFPSPDDTRPQVELPCSSAGDHGRLPSVRKLVSEEHREPFLSVPYLHCCKSGHSHGR